MKEWEKHLERAGEKRESANLLFEGDMFADAISEAYYAMFHASKALLALRTFFQGHMRVWSLSSACSLSTKVLLRNWRDNK
jgi:uncharacterized protein (UPF0332 family)